MCDIEDTTGSSYKAIFNFVYIYTRIGLEEHSHCRFELGKTPLAWMMENDQNKAKSMLDAKK
jgi:hypothetical protein